MADLLTVERDAGTEVTRLTVAGELDVAGGNIVREAMEQAALDRAAHVLIDLRGVTFLDSSGLAAVLAAARTLDQHGTTLSSYCPPGSEARLVIEMAGVDRLLGLQEEPAATP
jgi:anti-sigma B factor antagonist